MTDQALRQLALDYVAGHIVFGHLVPQAIRHMIFMPLIFLDEKTRAEWKKNDIVSVVGDVRTVTTSRGINGYPIFYELRPLTRSDYNAVVTYIEEAEKLRSAFLNSGRPSIPKSSKPRKSRKKS